MLDPTIFKDYPDLKVGDMVRYDCKKPHLFNHGIGWVRLIWMGLEEVCEIQSQGCKVSVCRALGDEVELL